MARHSEFWDCNVCGAQNHQEDGECQFCECQGKECKRDNCSDPRHFEALTCHKCGWRGPEWDAEPTPVCGERRCPKCSSDELYAEEEP